MRTAWLAFSIIGLVACSAPFERHSETRDAIVFVSFDSSDHGNIPRCVADTVQRAQRTLTVLPPRRFRDAIFPWLEAGTAPRDVEGFARLLGEPVVMQRVEELHVRYIAIISGTTTMEPFRGGWGCFGGPGAGGCAGFSWANRETRITTAIWDMKTSTLGNVSSEVKGRWMIPVFMLPVPILQATESPACEAIAQQIVDYLAPLK